MAAEGPGKDLWALGEVTATFVSLISSIDPSQWRLPTPCREWDLATLVDHVTGGNWFTSAVMGGETADAAMAHAMARFGDGSASCAQAIESAYEQLVVFRRDAVLDETWEHVSGPLEGRDILRIRIHELIVHSWDVAEALRSPASIPPELVTWGADELSSAGSLAAGHVLAGAGPDPRPVAPTQAAYLSVFGRDLPR